MTRETEPLVLPLAALAEALKGTEGGKARIVAEYAASDGHTYPAIIYTPAMFSLFDVATIMYKVLGDELTNNILFVARAENSGEDDRVLYFPGVIVG